MDYGRRLTTTGKESEMKNINPFFFFFLSEEDAKQHKLKGQISKQEAENELI